MHCLSHYFDNQKATDAVLKSTMKFLGKMVPRLKKFVSIFVHRSVATFEKRSEILYTKIWISLELSMMY